MFSLIVCGVFLACTVNAGFFYKQHHHPHRLSIDMNGFHDGMFNQNRHYGQPPPPVYGPPQFSHPHHHHQHHHHGPDCNHGHGDGFGYGNMMPFNPHFGHNMPFMPQRPPNFNNPHYSQQNPFGTYPSNHPVDPYSNSWPTTDFNTPIPPLDANTVFTNPNIDDSSTSSSNRPFNGNNQPQNGIPSDDSSEREGSMEATNPSNTISKTDQNNDNNYNGAEANEPNNNFDINNQANVPTVSEPTTTTSSVTQGNNDLIYDIDVRFGDSNNNRTNEKPLDTVK